MIPDLTRRLRPGSPMAAKTIGLVSLLTVLAGEVAPRTAQAYNGTEHIRFPDQAYQILNIMRRGAFYAEKARRLNPAGTYSPLTARPSNVPAADDADWQRFVTQALAAPARLDNVPVGLVDPRLSSPDCHGVFPPLPVAGTFARCRAGELSFPPRRYWQENPNECYLRRGYVFGGADMNADPSTQVAPFFQELPSNYTGALLGLWATRPDDEIDDTHLWIRPSHLLFYGALKGLVETVADVGLAVLFVPFACLGELIFSGDNCVDDAVNFSHTVNPVSLIDQSIGIAELLTAGNKTFTSNNWPLNTFGVSLAGLWHFININKANDGRFNRPPGMRMIDGGFPGSTTTMDIDPLDLGIVAAGDLLGVTLHPFRSNGVANYGFFSNDPVRLLGDWINPTVGHVEFEPLDNLARYGSQIFRNGERAKGLGWGLHAVGDAAQPHHLIGSLGWGHAAWEKFAQLSWPNNFSEPVVQVHYPALAEAVSIAFQWWRFMDGFSLPGGDLPFGELTEELARQTFAQPFSRDGRIFRAGTPKDGGTDDQVRAAYAGEEASARALMVTSVGASIALLVRASRSVQLSVTPTPCSCGPGEARSGQDRFGRLESSLDGTCVPCGTGIFAALPHWLEGRCVSLCPTDKPTVENGACVPAGTCPTERPLVENGACVPRCTLPFVVNNRECRSECPAGEFPDSANFCAPPVTPPARAVCSDALPDFTAACCLPRAALCVTSQDCCSGGCFLPDGLCQGGTNEPCVTNDGCASGVCTGGTCRAQAGGRCSVGTDCISTVCANSVCMGRNGDTCSTNDHCLSNSCAGGFCRGENGEGCLNDNGCLSGICFGGICGRPPGSRCFAPGECRGDSQCVSGICCFSIGHECSLTVPCCLGSTCNSLRRQCEDVIP